MINKTKSINVSFGSLSWQRVEDILSKTCSQMTYYAHQLPSVALSFYQDSLFFADTRIDNPVSMRVYDLSMRVSYRSNSFFDACLDDMEFSKTLQSLFSRFRDYARLLYVMGVYLLLDWDIANKKFTYSLQLK